MNQEQKKITKEDLELLGLFKQKYCYAIVREDSILENQNSKMENMAKGAQHKGPITLDEDGKGHLKFVKLDETVPDRGQHFVNDAMGFKYSSVQEDICTSFLKSIQNKEDFDSLHYSFEIFERHGQQITGTVSDNYLHDPEAGVLKEFVLSMDKKKVMSYDYVLVDDEEYYDKVQKNRNNENILKNLVEFYTRYGVKEENAKAFILNLVAFDLITGNWDRKSNPTNLVMIKYSNGDVKPFNMDYGRSLVMELPYKDYYDLKAKNYDDESDEEKLEFIELRAECDCDKIKVNNPSVFDTTNMKDTVQFLLDQGFEPFQINRKKMEEGHKKLLEKIKKYKGDDLIMMTEVQIEMLRQFMEDENLKKLWEDVKE